MTIRSAILASVIWAFLWTIACYAQEERSLLKPAPTVTGHWAEGDQVLADWSGDEFWYPAKIAERKDGRYHVAYLDGDEEWTTPDRVVAEDLKVGDRVLANWKNQGQYYPGRITRRDGQTIDVLYDDGDRETTTIDAVRVAAHRPVK